MNRAESTNLRPWVEFQSPGHGFDDLKLPWLGETLEAHSLSLQWLLRYCHELIRTAAPAKLSHPEVLLRKRVVQRPLEKRNTLS